MSFKNQTKLFDKNRGTQAAPVKQLLQSKPKISNQNPTVKQVSQPPKKDKSKGTPWLEVYNKIIPHFRPENIKSYYPVPEDRPSPLNITIETPPNFAASHFEVQLPPLYTHISHVSLVSYTVVSPPLDSSGNPCSTALIVCFPQLPKLSHIVVTHADLGNGSNFGSNSGGVQAVQQHLLTDSCITLPITGGCTQCEYVPERVLVNEFTFLPGLHSNTSNPNLLQSSSISSLSRANSSQQAISGSDSTTSIPLPSPSSRVNCSNGVLHIVLLGADGERMAVQRLFMLLRVYALGNNEGMSSSSPSAVTSSLALSSLSGSSGSSSSSSSSSSNSNSGVGDGGGLPPSKSPVSYAVLSNAPSYSMFFNTPLGTGISGGSSSNVGNSNVGGGGGGGGERDRDREKDRDRERGGGNNNPSGGGGTGRENAGGGGGGGGKDTNQNVPNYLRNTQASNMKRQPGAAKSGE